MGWLLAVHSGAGRYAVRDDPAYVALIEQALREGAELLEAEPHSSSSSSVAAAAACRMLRVFERAELTNAGAGANLTARGRVECEASAVCGRSSLVSAVAKVRGVAEPSALALALLEQAAASSSGAPGAGASTVGAGASTDSVFAFGRQAPLVVVGKHTRALARDFGLETVGSDEDLDAFQVTPRAETHWRKWHAKFQAHACGSEAPEDEQLALDTVGAICVDPSGNVAAALSSGGIAYKVPGRVGLAGCPRMGCDAANARRAASAGARELRKRKRGASDSEDTAERRRHGFAVACTGRGEHLVRSRFVSRLSHALGKKRRWPPHLESAMREAFVSGRDDNGGVPIEGGVLALSLSERRASSSGAPEPLTFSVQLGATFSTPSMGVGFLRSGSEPQVQILRQPPRVSHAADAGELLLSTHVSLFEL